MFRGFEATAALVPVTIFVTHYHVWNLVTSCFYEQNFIKMFLELGIFYHITRRITISKFEIFGLYFGSTVLACTLFTTAYCFTRFFATQMEEMIFEPIYGASGVIICMSVYARQQLKNESVALPFPFITYHNFPLIIIAIQITLWVTGFSFLARDLPFSIISLLYSWSFLRFYYHFDESELVAMYATSSTSSAHAAGASAYGDSSDDFSFVNMCPSVCVALVIYI